MATKPKPVGALTQRNNKVVSEWYCQFFTQNYLLDEKEQIVIRLNKNIIGDYPKNIAKIYRKSLNLESTTLSDGTKLILSSLLQANGSIKKAHELWMEAQDMVSVIR